MGRFLEVAPGQATLKSGPSADIPDGWVRIAVRACCLCGTDRHLFNGMDLPRGARYPIRPGHEVAGIVSDSAGSDFAIGEQVVLHPLLPCGQCAACVGGHENRCRTAKALGIDAPGGLADEVIWPANRLVACPNLDPPSAAILCDAVATAYRAVMRAGVPRGGALTLVGAGGVGVNVLKLARVLDPDVRLTAVVRNEAAAERIDGLVSNLHVVLGLEGAGARIARDQGPQDAVIEFGPGADAAAEAFPMLARGGRLVFGAISGQQLALPTTVTSFVTRELEIVGTYTSTIDDLRAVVALAVEGQLNLAASISHRIPLAEAEWAFTLLRERAPGVARIAIVP